MRNPVLEPIRKQSSMERSLDTKLHMERILIFKQFVADENERKVEKALLTKKLLKINSKSPSSRIIPRLDQRIPTKRSQVYKKPTVFSLNYQHK